MTALLAQLLRAVHYNASVDCCVRVMQNYKDRRLVERKEVDCDDFDKDIQLGPTDSKLHSGGEIVGNNRLCYVAALSIACGHVMCWRCILF